MAHREPELDPTQLKQQKASHRALWCPLSGPRSRLAGLLLTLDIFSTGLLLIEYESSTSTRKQVDYGKTYPDRAWGSWREPRRGPAQFA